MGSCTWSSSACSRAARRKLESSVWHSGLSRCWFVSLFLLNCSKETKGPHQNFFFSKTTISLEDAWKIIVNSGFCRIRSEEIRGILKSNTTYELLDVSKHARAFLCKCKRFLSTRIYKCDRWDTLTILINVNCSARVTRMSLVTQCWLASHL